MRGGVVQGVICRGTARLPDDVSIRDHPVDRSLLVGNPLFGIGWGLAGYCPGPALVGLAPGNDEVLVFLVAMVTGGFLQQWWARPQNDLQVRSRSAPISTGAPVTRACDTITTLTIGALALTATTSIDDAVVPHFRLRLSGAFRSPLSILSACTGRTNPGLLRYKPIATRGASQPNRRSDPMKSNLGLACLCGFLLCAFPSPSARAVSTSTDYTALWWNASESGWGMNIIQQEQILFITLFIYGATGAPTWLVGSNVGFVSANAAGDRTYTGDLYATTGTPFSTVPFNPAATTVLPVGKITFVGLANGTATVQYTAGVTSVSKAVVRQTWAQPEFTLNQASAYSAAQSGTTTSCVLPGDNGSGSTTYPQLALYVNSLGSTMRLEITVTDEESGTCILQGNNYVQEGRFGKATLTGRCSFIPPPAPSILFEASEVDIGASYFTLRYRISQGIGDGCVETGTIVGARK